jgi:prepilin-type processing-associated H-X9-DG protein
MLVPPIDQLMPHLAPAGQSSWVDDDGWHMSAVTPFPGADLLAQDPLSTMMTAQPAIMASILVPSLNRARTTANRVKSASNLKQIGNGLFLYANDHKGKFPDTLGELAAATDDLPPSVFVNPNGNTEAPNAAPDKATLSAWVNDSSDYVYLGAGKTNAESPETIIAYEKPETNDNQGMNVLFGDGHVEWLDYHSGMERINAQLAKEKNPADKL